MKKSVLITGAFGGMGKAAVEEFARLGFHVFALDKRVGAPSDNVTPIEADVTDEESVKAAFLNVCRSTDELVGIIHFAGIYMLDSLVEISTVEFETIFKVNLEGAFLINKTFLPLLHQGSRIIITTSELAPLDPLPFTGIYAITKSALDKYAYSLRMELQLKGIDVCVLRAGAVSTGMLGASTEALELFNSKTEIYSCNAKRFKNIVDRVEARSVHPSKIAKKTAKILGRKRTSFSYSINRNPLLLLLNVLPKRLQLWVIKQVLKNK